MNHRNFMGQRILLLILFLFTTTIATAEPEGVLIEQIAKDYMPSPKAVKELKAVNKKFDVVLFHGAWCPDCRQDVPKLMKILAVVQNPNLNLIDYKVDRNKKDVLSKFEEYEIRKVPTYIVLYNGEEIGRVEKEPRKSLEDDLLFIFKHPKSSS